MSNTNVNKTASIIGINAVRIQQLPDLVSQFFMSLGQMNFQLRSDEEFLITDIAHISWLLMINQMSFQITSGMKKLSTFVTFDLLLCTVAIVHMIPESNCLSKFLWTQFTG